MQYRTEVGKMLRKGNKNWGFVGVNDFIVASELMLTKITGPSAVAVRRIGNGIAC